VLDGVIIKISEKRYKELVNDVKEDVLKEVLEELDTHKNKGEVNGKSNNT
jgi:hypothetical protein